MNINELTPDNWLFFAIQNYRVKITSANGTEEVITDGAGTLTFGS